LAVLPENDSLPARLGKVLRAQAVKIGIITALPKEFAAVRVMLEEEVLYPIAGDPGDYVLGTIPGSEGSGYHIVAVSLLKEMGNNSASAAASHLIRSFPTVEDILMVGIAGGIPCLDSPSEHVRLGDVVVSDRFGVVQYDNLKVGSSNITIRSTSAKPSARLLGAVNFLESESCMKKYPWEEFLKLAFKLEHSERPPDKSDELYGWDDSGIAKLLAHPADPTRREGKPKIHLGRIGASNTLLKNPKLRDQLRRDCQIKAIEMESSGIADAAWTAGQGFLAVRGICDYCDEKKNNTWQAYAALAAAAYTRALISSLSATS
jgi:nucleoside phosphorylase